MISQSRIRALRVEVHSAKAKGNPMAAYQSLAARHRSGQIRLTYEDLVWLGYLLEYRYGWATFKALELGIFSYKEPVIIPKGTE